MAQTLIDGEDLTPEMCTKTDTSKEMAKEQILLTRSQCGGSTPQERVDIISSLITHEVQDFKDSKILEEFFTITNVCACVTETLRKMSEEYCAKYNVSREDFNLGVEASSQRNLFALSEGSSGSLLKGLELMRRLRVMGFKPFEGN
jgi:hypothetical protein